LDTHTHRSSIQRMASSRLTMAYFLRYCYLPHRRLFWTKNHEKVSLLMMLTLRHLDECMMNSDATAGPLNALSVSSSCAVTRYYALTNFHKFLNLKFCNLTHQHISFPHLCSCNKKFGNTVRWIRIIKSQKWWKLIGYLYLFNDHKRHIKREKYELIMIKAFVELIFSWEKLNAFKLSWREYWLTLEGN